MNNNTIIYVARASNSKRDCEHDLYYCLLPQCEALRTCRSGFPIATLSIKKQNGVLLSNEKNILGKWKDYIKDVLNAVNLTPSNTLEVHLWEYINILAAKAFLAVKPMNAAGCDEIRPIMLQALS